MRDTDKVLPNRFTGVFVALAALVLLASGRAEAVGNCGVSYTYALHDTVSAANLNGNILQASTTNSTPQCVDDYSANALQMQTTTDPYPAGVESLATSLAGELERLRYVHKTRCGQTQWYTHAEACTMATALSATALSGIQGTITSATPLFNGTVTWNSGGTTFTALKLNVTNTASAADSLLLNLQVGGSSQFAVSKAGAVTIGGNLDVTATGAALAAGHPGLYNAGGTVLTHVGGSTATDWKNNANNATRMRLTDAGILLFGTTNLVNAAAGDIVLANATAYRSGNAAASDTFRLIEGDSSNRTLINGGGLNGVVVNAPGPSVWGGTTPLAPDRFLVTGAFSTGGGGSGFRVTQTLTKTDNTATYGAVFDVGMSTPASGAMGIYAQVFAQGPSVTKNGTATLPTTAAIYIPFASLDGVENYGLWSKAPMLIGTTALTVTGTGIGINKMAATGVAPGAAGAKFEVVCGTNAGTAKLIMYAGTSGTAVTVVDNVGAAVTGC